MSEVTSLATCLVCGEVPADYLPDRGPGYVQEMTDHAMFCVDTRDESKIVRAADGLGAWFLSVYEVERAYGGPEEGGWWFDSGERRATFVAPTLEDAVGMREDLRDDEYRDMAYSEWRIVITRGNAGPDYFPEQAPRYE